jgi:hypothetical protein
MSKNTIFKDTTSFNQTTATELKTIIDAKLALMGVSSVKVGSDKTILNDLDLQLELSTVATFFGTTDDKDTRIALREYFEQQGFESKRNGINVFIRVPFASTAHQVDLEVIHNVDKIARYHQHNIPAGSPFKGVSKQLLIGALAKDMGFMYSAWEGLFIRTADNKKGKMYAIDWDDIAEILLGPTATGTDLDCVENILAKLPAEQGQDLLNRCRLDKNWYEAI